MVDKSRREMLIQTARYATVAAITYSISDFAVRAMGEECVNESVCDACLAAEGCQLPLGLEFKSEKEKKDPINLEALPKQEDSHGQS